MVVVLGLVTVMLGLLLGVTVTVYQGIRSSYDYQASIQFFIHMKNDAACPHCSH